MMDRESYQRWLREWEEVKAEVHEMPVGRHLTQYKIVSGPREGSITTAHFFKPRWPLDPESRPSLGILAAVMTNYTDLHVLGTIPVGPDEWPRAESFAEYCARWPRGLQNRAPGAGAGPAAATD